MRVEIAGEQALIIYFAETATPQVSARVQQAVTILEAELNGYLIDLIPSYASLLLIFDMLACDHLYIRHRIRELLAQSGQADVTEGKLVQLPAYYSAESGPDLENLAESAGLTVAEVIKRHSAIEYRVYAIGFAPGFAYLGDVDPRLATPRLATPRQKVPRGSIAIADRQTAVYPAASPGGWNLIGLCPTPMFDPQAEPNMPVQVGDRVCFTPISREEFQSLGGTL
ncbi:MAG: allophanate hydrolase [Neptuniibacter caesariensis]|uniref:Allophanate hydrolase n=1 Tax=Neptuniibacter caesariensis TaxID=207954 RepID=A0A2G6JNR3_NEPCE|nr:MAG: allophanate hydrolase [Neptuniibacter caesariensis]